jgi:hypothetical protein
MAQDKRKDSLDDILGIDPFADVNDDFERYLKEKTCDTPVSEMTTTDRDDPDPLFTPKTPVMLEAALKDGIPVVVIPTVHVAADEWTAPSPSPKTVAEDDEFTFVLPSSAPVADSLPNPDALVVGTQTPEQQTQLHVRGKEGYQYITETVAPSTVDEEWKKVFIESYKMGVTSMSAEQIVTRFHDLERTIYLIRAQQQGIRLSLEDVLQATSIAERIRVMEMDKKLKIRAVRKSADPEGRKGSKPKTEASKAKATKKYSAAVKKSIDLYIETFGWSKAQITEKFLSLGKLTQEAKDYLDDCFSK